MTKKKVGKIYPTVTSWLHEIFFFVFIGFHVPLKMKKATVSLCASMAESRKRRRSFHKKHGTLCIYLTSV